MTSRKESVSPAAVRETRESIELAGKGVSFILFPRQDSESACQDRLVNSESRDGSKEKLFGQLILEIWVIVPMSMFAFPVLTHFFTELITRIVLFFL